MKRKVIKNTKSFLSNASVRGFSRIIKTESHFVKGLWSIFIISNLILLMVSIQKEVVNYMQYSVNIQTYTKFDSGVPFPAVTFCNNQPFSLTAYKLWNSRQAMSPTEFNKKLRDRALKYLETDADTMDKLWYMSFLWSTIMDRTSMYYQSVDPDIAAIIGHNQSMLHHCLVWHGSKLVLEQNCQDSLLIVKRFSHPSYFNCFILEAKADKVNHISKIGAIVRLGPNEDFDVKYKQGFLFDIFEQAFGLRVAIHEAGSYPNIDKIGQYIEAGSISELNFKAVLNTRVNSPTKLCIENPTTTYKDLDNLFKYDKEICLNNEIQKIVVDKCKCMYGHYPRFIRPNKRIPYCGLINFENHTMVYRNLKCLSKEIIKTFKLRKQLEESVCLLRCTNIDYKLSVSVTKWRPTEWQLYWYKQLVKHFSKTEDLFTAYNSNLTKESEKLDIKLKIEGHFEYLKTYMKKENLSIYNNTAEFQTNPVSKNRYALVVIRRRDNNTFINEERFVLTFSALISRVGGLSSLYIGLTFAFFVEVIEYFYVCLFSKTLTTKSENVSEAENDDPEEHNIQEYHDV